MEGLKSYFYHFRGGGQYSHLYSFQFIFSKDPQIEALPKENIFF